MKEIGIQSPIIIVSGTADIQFTVAAFEEYHILRFFTKYNFESQVAYFIKAVRSAIRISVEKAEPSSGEKVSELITIQTRVEALDYVLYSLELKWKSGDISDGEYFRLLESRQVERLQLLTEVKLALQGTKAQDIQKVLEVVQGGDEEQAVKDLEELITQKKWGDDLLEQIEKYKPQIITAAISIAIEVIKKFAGI